ncbi:tumor protein p53-inducible protein 13 [Dunckerocampus dactyliophorus]|uniref:tumor protein p53-inducible protein 13 n=1 Tax=Dunckerocampus dactyliophorus TaxID=161453 RepID=UPI002405A09E|nr:tumor protein p53-inducible protein 13 [Dunckerocampus dactyliophorus]
MPTHTVTVLAALSFCLGRCTVSEYQGSQCDNGKLFVERDLPLDAAYKGCPVSGWLDSIQRLPSVYTVYDPEPARQICMDKPISYRHSIPNSGAYRPVRAESGEYLYCPPQRWLNNLHHGAAVLLYHPCAAVSERLLVSVLATSCLPDYIISPHPQLSKSKPIALVSWGQTLELSTAASSDVCHWLQSTTTTSERIRGKYNLLLTQSSDQQRQKHTHGEEGQTEPKESLRQCCERIISLWLEAEKDSTLKDRNGEERRRESRKRQKRAAMRPKQNNVAMRTIQSNSSAQASSVLTKPKLKNIINKPENTSDHNNTHGPPTASPGHVAHSDPLHLRTATSLTMIQNQGFSAWPPNRLTSNMLGATHKTLLGVPETQRDWLEDGASSQVKGSLEQREPAKYGSTAQMLDNQVVDVRERQLEKGDRHSLKGQDESPPSEHSTAAAVNYLPNTHDCGSCVENQLCDCSKDPEGRATLVSNGLPRTPRSDEAVWAAAALGFLLVLLTLSVLHTRLYRHWRTMPSLYWHDARQDYDSVADVIRRRLQIAKRRRKRGRRQECALLPSSSSSEEHM